MQLFEIMIQVVSFDYFPFTDYYDFGFSETPPWNLRFEWLGYESINFVDLMGSLIILAFIGFMYAVFVIFISSFGLRSRITSKAMRSCCKRRTVFIKALVFMQGTVFTFIICI